MKNCLVTKLKGVVDNNDLEKLGEGRITCALDGINSPTYTFKWFDSGSHTISIISGDSSINLLDTNGNSLGRTHTFTGNLKQIKLPAIQSNVVLGLSNKYNFEVISKNGTWCPTYIDMEYFMTTNPDVIHRFAIPNNCVVKDGFKGVANKKFDTLQCMFSHSSGDNINGLATTMATNILANSEYFAAYSNFTGDISVVNTSILFLKIGGNFTWITGRQYSNTVLVLNGDKDITGINLGNYVDAYLNNMAQCRSYISTSSPEYSIISIKGTRTSASDAAVAALKESGYTVKVNGTTL